MSHQVTVQLHNHPRTISRIVTFIHPAQRRAGWLYLVTFCDADPGFEQQIESWRKDPEAICIYDGPPNVG